MSGKGKDVESSIDKVSYNRLTNKAKSARNDLAHAFLSLSLVLKEIYDNQYFMFEFRTFKEYCELELNIEISTAYDYIKIANFIEENKDFLSVDKAELLGHKKLKLLAQKLSQVEKKFRKGILKNVDVHDSYPKIREKIEVSLLSIHSRKKE